MSDATDFVSREEIEAMVLAKAVEDPAFAARLKADAKAALSEMFDTKLPASLTVHVFQETPTDLMIRLPVVVDDEISEQELEGVAGGLCTPLKVIGIKKAAAAIGKVAIGGAVGAGVKKGAKRW
jgi:hypothetical protein